MSLPLHVQKVAAASGGPPPQKAEQIVSYSAPPVVRCQQMRCIPGCDIKPRFAAETPAFGDEIPHARVARLSVADAGAAVGEPSSIRITRAAVRLRQNRSRQRANTAPHHRSHDDGDSGNRSRHLFSLAAFHAHASLLRNLRFRIQYLCGQCCVPDAPRAALCIGRCFFSTIHPEAVPTKPNTRAFNPGRKRVQPCSSSKSTSKTR
jgi:hypothetical protein